MPEFILLTCDSPSVSTTTFQTNIISLIAHLSIDIFIFGFLYDLITDRTNRNMNLLVEKPEISKKYNKLIGAAEIQHIAATAI